MTSRNVSPALAFTIAALGIGLFSMMDAVMKSLVLAIGVYNALLWRQIISVGLGAVAWKIGKSGRPSGRALRLHLARGLVTTAMALLFFWGLARLPMAQAVSLTYIAPILALLLGALMLGERVGRKAVLASVAALGGVLVVMIGQGRGVAGPEAFHGTLAVLGSAVLPELTQWPTLLLAAGLSTASLWLLGWAYAHGDTGFLATTEYTSFVYAAVLGFLVFGERVSAFTVAGATVIVIACLYTTRRRDSGEPQLR